VWGIAWIIVIGALTAVGLVIAFALTGFAPLIALLVLAIVGFGSPLVFGARRLRAGTEGEISERETARRGTAPAAGEGGAPASAESQHQGTREHPEGYEPAV
jgi:hypothetical protein